MFNNVNENHKTFNFNKILYGVINCVDEVGFNEGPLIVQPLDVEADHKQSIQQLFNHLNQRLKR